MTLVKGFPQHVRRAFAVIVLVGACASCKTPSAVYGTVTGRVVDLQSQLPINGATISIGNVSALTSVSDQGGFVLPRIPVGKQTLSITAVGWTAYRMTISVDTNETTNVGNIGLASALRSP